MPFTLLGHRPVLAPASLALAVLLAGCGGNQDGGNGANVEMMGLEKADGTINDAMTDLDGVRVEGTAMAETGNGSSTGGNSAAPAAATPGGGNQAAAAQGEEEVVAEQ